MLLLKVAKAIKNKLSLWDRVKIQMPAKQARILAACCAVGALVLPAVPCMLLSRSLDSTQLMAHNVFWANSLHDLANAQSIKGVLEFVPESDRAAVIEQATGLHSEGELEASIATLKAKADAEGQAVHAMAAERNSWGVLLALTPPFLLSWFLAGLAGRFVAAWRNKDKPTDLPSP